MRFNYCGKLLVLASAAAIAGCGTEPTTPTAPVIVPSFLIGPVTTTSTIVTPSGQGGAANNIVGVTPDAAPGYSAGSFAANATVAGAKSEMYFTPEGLFGGREVALGDVASMSYWTKTGTTHTADPRDWFLNIYTKPYGGDVSTPTWYGDRIGAEPYFSAGLTDPANTWNEWTTGAATNKLRFFESTAGPLGATFGSYSDPDWATLIAGNALSGSPYAAHKILYFSLQTGSAWANGFTGQLDGLRIELTDGSVATVNFEPDPNWGSCLVSVLGSTYTLLANCTTDQTLLVPDGFTLDGNGFSITAVDPAGGHFLGAVVRNGGTSANVTNLTVTASGLANVCDGGNDRLRGILFEGASGSITRNVITNVNQGPSGCQEGNAIEARNAPFDNTGSDLTVTIDGNTVNGYIKNGITANGSVAATITNNVITGSGAVGVPLAAQNGIQIGFGATAIVRGNASNGNNYTPKSWVACGLLIYQADGVRTSSNSYSGNERDVCNYGKGGGTFNPNP